MTCRTDDLDKDIQNDTGASKACSSSNGQASAVDNLLDDDFFQEYLKKRIEEMQKKSLSL